MDHSFASPRPRDVSTIQPRGKTQNPWYH